LYCFIFGMDMNHQSSVNKAYLEEEVKISVSSLYVKTQKFEGDSG